VYILDNDFLREQIPSIYDRLQRRINHANNRIRKGLPFTSRPADFDDVIELDDLNVEKEADELLYFIMNNPDCLSFVEYTRNKGYMACHLTDIARRSEHFMAALEKCREIIADNREKAVSKGTLHPIAFNKRLRVYDRLVKNCEDDDLEDALRRRKDLITHEYDLKCKLESSKQNAPHDELLRTLIEAIKAS